MTELVSPREGWYWDIGNFLIHLNWAKSWDGWGDVEDDGTKNWYPLKISFSKVGNASYLTFILWKLLFEVGKA